MPATGRERIARRPFPQQPRGRPAVAVLLAENPGLGVLTERLGGGERGDGVAEVVQEERRGGVDVVAVGFREGLGFRVGGWPRWRGGGGGVTGRGDGEVRRSDGVQIFEERGDVGVLALDPWGLVYG